MKRWLKNDRGAALITVLMIVAVMATIAVITFEALGYSIKRSTARRMYDQARFYALGGEQLALVATGKIADAGLHLVQPRAVSYPIEGGRIEGFISDKSSCFNVNSLVEINDAGRLVAYQFSMGIYQRLLTSLGLAERRASELSAALVDWLDSDTRPVSLGAEDYDYAALVPPYRAANTLMADISELTMVKGYSGDVLALLRPHVCVGYSNSLPRLNVNVLAESDAPMLAAIVGPAFSVEKALDVITARPAGGYETLADFWNEKGFSGLTVPQEVRQLTSVKGTVFESRIRVQFHDAVTHMTSMIYVDSDAQSRLLARRFGILN